jgi:hypothetical protein
MGSGNYTRMSDMSCTAFSKWWLVGILIWGSACVSREEREAGSPAPRVDRVVPDKVVAGQPFQVQPGGESAVAVTGENLIAGSRVRLNGEALATAWSEDGRSASAIVPPELFAEPGMYPLSVESPSGQVSNAIPFTVLPKTGPAPVVKRLYPETAVAGKPFNEQPGGKSALGVVGENFLPGAAIEIDGEAQETTFNNTDNVAALVPVKFTSKPRRLRITVRNPDGKRSEPAELILTAP